MINMTMMRSFVLVALFLPLLSLAQDVTDVCRDLTPENRILAEASGMDVDALCGEQILGVAPAESTAEPIVTEPITAEPIVTEPITAGPIIEPLREPTVAPTVKPPAASDLLLPFGYDLFAGFPTTFTPDVGIPVLPDYLLGPGDTLQILFYGKTNVSFDLEINRDGYVNFPELGPIGLTGLTFDEAKKMLLTRISKQMIGVQASISLGELRSMQIFILGEAYKPGAYTVSSLSTITNALIASGGVSDIASLRNIQLKRAGEVIVTLDLYDLLLKGDMSGDLRLQAYDVIYIPTVGDLVSVDGEVLRPAIYELKGNTTAQQLVGLAGGLGSKAFPSSARIERINDSGFMTVINLDLTEAKGQNLPVIGGDHLRVGTTIVDRKENIVTLSGHVYRPGDFHWKAGMRISDLISEIGQFKDKVDLDFTLLQRELPPIGKVQMLAIDLRSVLANAGSEADLLLFPRDELLIFGTEISRSGQLIDLLGVLKDQARSGELALVVSISGSVKYPGDYPLTPGMTLTQVIQAAGGLNEEAYTQRADVSRIDLSDPELAKYQHQYFELAAAFDDPSTDLQLLPYDKITIRPVPDWKATALIDLEGEYRFPGEHTFVRGETLSQIIKRAGGLTDFAHIKAAIFTREELRLREEENLTQLRLKLEADIAQTSLRRSTAAGMTELAFAQERLFSRLEQVQGIGRLVIDLQSILDGTIDDINLRDGDALYIPAFSQEVSVIGEIQYPASHLYEKNLRAEDYLERSGGMTSNADEKRVYIVKADGSVSLPSGNSRFFRNNLIIEPGDTLVVPFNVDKMKPLTAWSEVTQVIYQLAIATAAVNSF